MSGNKLVFIAGGARWIGRSLALAAARAGSDGVIHYGQSQDEAESVHAEIEALAADLACICLEEPGVQQVLVRVEKPGAVRFSRSTEVEIERTKEDMV